MSADEMVNNGTDEMSAAGYGVGGSPDEAALSSQRLAGPVPKHRPVSLHFSRENGIIDELLDQLIKSAGGIVHAEITREMILAALKAGQESDEKADLKLMLSTLKEMRFTSKVFGPYRQIKKVSVFGSARVQRSSGNYQMARLLGEKLARSGCMLITGGGEGIMQAVNEGAGPDHSFGVCIRLPFEKQPNEVVEGTPRSITYKYFFNRKVALVKETDGVVVFPGGFGTMDETMEILTLLQTGKRTPIPLILLEEPGGTYWTHWIEFLRDELASHAYINGRDVALFDRVVSVDDAVERICGFYKRYHSMRYVGERLVIRITSPLNPQTVAGLRRDFEDLLKPGGEMILTDPLPEESEDSHAMGLPRLVLDFNRKDFTRLKQLIHAINAV